MNITFRTPQYFLVTLSVASLGSRPSPFTHTSLISPFAIPNPLKGPREGEMATYTLLTLWTNFPNISENDQFLSFILPTAFKRQCVYTCT